MPEKLIRLTQLQRFKQKADAKYQDKLTAGNNITISGNTISAFAAQSNPTYDQVSFSKSVPSGTITSMGSVTLMPGTYFVVYQCRFPYNSGSNKYRQCGFSTSTTDITGFGRSWGDYRKNINVVGIYDKPRVAGVCTVSASDYPNGRTFYLLARQNSSSAITAVAFCHYIKLV